MKTIYSVVPGALHAQAATPGKHKAATVAPARDGKPGDHHYSPEAVGAMTLVGVVGLVTCAVCVLLFIKLVRFTFGGTRRREVA